MNFGYLGDHKVVTSIQPPNVKDVDINSVPYLVHMTRAGIRIDPEKFAILSHKLAIKIQDEEARAWVSVGEAFNLGSDDQVAKMLFIKLGLSPKKKTKGGKWSVNEDVLEEIKEQHPIIPHILEHRRLSKLKGTYADGLPKKANTENRIYARWNGAFVETGRLSCSGPNLMQIPARDEEAKDIKLGFIPEPGKVFVALDYGQVELRTAAHISQDQGMIDAFWRGEDIHLATAMDSFNISSPELVSYVQRRDAKILNFGVLFGLTPYGLLNNIPAEEKDPYIHTKAWAEDFIQRYFRARPGLKKYIDATKAFVRRFGYVQDVFGRVRWIPEVASSQARIRAEGERNAINMPIQATAAGIMRIAMGDMLSVNGSGALDAYVESGLVRTPLQIHDQVILEVWEPIWRDVATMVKVVMERAAPWLSVPLVADVEMGPSWGELEKVKL